jgi:hypothetical protein
LAINGCHGDAPVVEEELMSAASRKLIIAEQVAGASQGALEYIDEELTRITRELIENRAQRESCVARLMTDEFTALGQRISRARELLAEGEDRIRAGKEFFRDLGEKFLKENGARNREFDAVRAAADAALPAEGPFEIVPPHPGEVRLLEAEFLSRVFGEEREALKPVANGEAAREEAHA